MTTKPQYHTCDHCSETKSAWAFYEQGPRICKDCRTANQKQAELDNIPEDERIPHQRGVYCNGEQDNYPAVTVVGQKANGLLWVMFDKQRLIGRASRTQFIVLCKPGYIHTGTLAEKYIERQRERLDKLIAESSEKRIAQLEAERRNRNESRTMGQ